MAEKPSVTKFRTLDNDIPELKRYLSRGMKVLDVGCGRGSTITYGVAEYVSPGEVIGIDPRSETVSEAIESTKEAVSEVAIQFAAGDVHSLDFADNTFDVAYSHTATHFFIDPVLALKEQRRVVKPGGWVIASGVRDLNFSSRVPHCPNWDAAMTALRSYYDSVTKRYESGGLEATEFMNREIERMSSIFAYFDWQSGRKCPGWFIEADLKNLEISIKADFIRHYTCERTSQRSTNMLPTKRGEESDKNIYDLIYDELLRQDVIDRSTLELAEEEALEWCDNPQAFFYCTLVIIAGQV